jgi:hypothetical protein
MNNVFIAINKKGPCGPLMSSHLGVKKDVFPIIGKTS